MPIIAHLQDVCMVSKSFVINGGRDCAYKVSRYQMMTKIVARNFQLLTPKSNAQLEAMMKKCANMTTVEGVAHTR